MPKPLANIFKRWREIKGDNHLIKDALNKLRNPSYFQRKLYRLWTSVSRRAIILKILFPITYYPLSVSLQLIALKSRFITMSTTAKLAIKLYTALSQAQLPVVMALMLELAITSTKTCPVQVANNIRTEDGKGYGMRLPFTPATIHVRKKSATAMLLLRWERV